MTTFSITLPDEDAVRLAELAEREGASVEDVARAALKARLDADEIWRSEILVGLAEHDAAKGVPFEDFEASMNEFMGTLRAGRS